MKVFATGRDDVSEAGQVVWIGEAMTDTSVADLRRVVNYLLVAGFEYFGADTKRQMILKVGPDLTAFGNISWRRGEGFLDFGFGFGRRGGC